MFTWAQELLLLGIVLVTYLIYNRKDTSSNGGNQSKAKAKSPRAPPVEFEKMNFYEVLEVSEDVTDDDLKKAYRKKALEHHPDKNLGDADGANMRFAKVQEAYDTLSDASLRADYDFIRKNAPEPPESTYPGEDSYDAPSSPARSFGFGNSFPEPINRLTPSRYMNQIPPPLGAKSISIQDLASFLEAFSSIQQSSHPVESTTFFTLFDGLFRCIAYDESVNGGRNTYATHCFGHFCHRWNARDALYCLEHRDGPFLEDFYNLYTKFKSSKNFSWMQFCKVRPQDLVYPQIRREVEKQNNIARKLYKENYEEFISALARRLKDLDPRRHRYDRYLRRGGQQPNQNNKKKKRRGRH